MDKKLNVLLGTWDQAIGTIVVAISDTPAAKISESIRFSLSSIGEVMQATGNALLSEDEEGFSKIGSELQAVGNCVVFTGLQIPMSERTKTGLEIQGNVLQASGSLLALLDGDVGQPTIMEKIFRHYASILQAVGNGLQALSGSLLLSGKKWEGIDFAGSWIQAIGALLQAIIQTKEILESPD